MTKRVFDFIVALSGLILLAPVFLVIAGAIKLFDEGPVFFCQERIGLGGRPFRIWKFRSMRVTPEKQGPSITSASDSRVTRTGRFLRKWKLDELPQLFNVLVGEMTIVGPRPEVPCYVALYTAKQRRVLALRPGITDLASIHFRNEEALLAKAEDPDRFYREYCIPEKIKLNLEYASRAGLIPDILLICATLAKIVRDSKTVRDSDVPRNVGDD